MPNVFVHAILSHPLTGASETHSRCCWQEQLEDCSWCHESKCSAYGKCSVITVISACYQQQSSDLAGNSKQTTNNKLQTFFFFFFYQMERKSHKSFMLLCFGLVRTDIYFLISFPLRVLKILTFKWFPCFVHRSTQNSVHADFLSCQERFFISANMKANKQKQQYALHSGRPLVKL